MLGLTHPCYEDDRAAWLEPAVRRESAVGKVQRRRYQMARIAGLSLAGGAADGGRAGADFVRAGIV